MKKFFKYFTSHMGWVLACFILFFYGVGIYHIIQGNDTATGKISVIAATVVLAFFTLFAIFDYRKHKDLY